MKKRYFALLLLLFIFVGCSKTNDTVGREPSERQVQKEVKKIEKKEEQKLVSEYPGMEVFYNTYEDEDFSFSYFEPEIEAEEVNETIHAWLKDQNKEFIEEVKYLNPSEEGLFSNYHIELDTKILNEEDEIYSLVFEETSKLSGTNHLTKYKSYNVGIKEDKIYKIQDFFGISSEELENLVYQKLSRQERVQESLDEEALKNVLGNMDQLNFRILNGDLYLYFDSYEILPGSFGGQVVLIPFSDIIRHCKDEAFHVLSEDLIEKVEIARKTPEERPKVENGVALTFDDGPNPTTTPQLLDILDRYHAKATFFILGQNAEKYPEIIKDMVNRGHEVACHSYSHPDFRGLSQEGLMKELTLCRDLVKSAGGVDPILVRPPYGGTNDFVRSTIESIGQEEVRWSVDTLDWKTRNPQAILQAVKDYTSSGDIVLMHDTHQTTIDSVASVVEYLQGQGYELVTVSQLP